MNDMSLIMESWRTFSIEETQFQLFEAEEENTNSEFQKDFEQWLSTQNLNEEQLTEIIQKVKDVWGAIKQKGEDLKEWTYEQYKKLVKPLLKIIKSFLDFLRNNNLLGKYRTRFEKHAVDLFSTEKYIKLGYVVLQAFAAMIIDVTVGLPKKVEAVLNIMDLIKAQNWKDLLSIFGIPANELSELIGGLMSFGKDTKKTYGMGDDQLGSGEFALAEGLTHRVKLKALL